MCARADLCACCCVGVLCASSFCLVLSSLFLLVVLLKLFRHSQLTLHCTGHCTVHSTLHPHTHRDNTGNEKGRGGTQLAGATGRAALALLRCGGALCVNSDSVCRICCMHCATVLYMLIVVAKMAASARVR